MPGSAVSSAWSFPPRNRRLRELAEAAAGRARGDAEATGILCTAQAEHLSYDRLLARFSSQARLHDLAVIDAEPRMLTGDRGLIETLLFESGRPLIVVPPGCGTVATRRILVAWDGSAQAARALHDALPFLRQAESVEIVVVTARRISRTRSQGPRWRRASRITASP